MKGWRHGYPRIECPECGGTNVQVYHTEGVMRYHKCLKCRHRFKSTEKHILGVSDQGENVREDQPYAHIPGVSYPEPA